MLAQNTTGCTASATVSPGKNRRPGLVLLSLDPGIRLAGPALFLGDQLKAAALVCNPIESGNELAACVEMGRELAAWVRIQCRELGINEPDEIAVEWPQVYASRIREGKTREDPNDLPPLAGVDCALAAHFPDATLYSSKPALWKWQLDKPTACARILSRLGESEAGALAKGVLGTGDPILYTDRINRLMSHRTAHNAIDGVGVGLSHLGRFKKHRVIAR